MNKQFVVAMTSIAMIASSCVSTSKTGFRKVASSSEVEAIAAQGKDLNFGSTQRARLLTQAEINKFASASNIKLQAGQILTGNDSAFDKKLELVQKATKSIRMVYFIYASDDSSSKLNQALIAKAKSGVRVTLLVDFVTNYKNLDLFSMLEREGGGYLRTYFYNIPNETMVRDANYMVLPCPKETDPTDDACFKSKQAELAKLGNPKEPTAFAKILLSGLYGKNGTALNIALGYGAKIDPKEYQAAKDQAGGFEAADMLKFAELVYEAVIKNSLVAKIKLSIAMTTYGDTLNPLVNELTGRLPLRSPNFEATNGKFWDHITDYTHHKLLAVDGNQFVLGGRNVEDSYHLNQRPADSKTGKYIFIDTDFWGQTAAGGARDIEASFDKLMDTSMVAALNKVKAITAYDFIANTGSKDKPGAAEAATQTCLANKATDLGSCVLNTVGKIKGVAGVADYKSEKERLDAKLVAMNESVTNYDMEYVAKGLKKQGSDFGPMSANDLQTAQVAYLENVNYQKGTNTRVIGSRVGFEAENGKNIQAVWYRGLENACKISRDEERQVRVIFNTAYLLMPAGMIHKIAKMMNGDYGNCSGVNLTFITNSPLTTDLGPINVLARYQLGPLFTHYARLVQYKTDFEQGGKYKYVQFFPTIEYFELKEGVNSASLSGSSSSSGSASGVANNSLHTKTSLIGDDLIIGSANADVRSYYMDTNNAILIRNAKDMNKAYIKYVDGLKESKTIEYKMSDFIGKSIPQLRAENKVMLEAFAKRWKQEGRLTADRVTSFLNHVDEAGTMIQNSTNRLILFRGDFNPVKEYTGESNQYQINKELNELANKYDAMFKVF